MFRKLYRGAYSAGGAGFQPAAVAFRHGSADGQPRTHVPKALSWSLFSWWRGLSACSRGFPTRIRRRTAADTCSESFIVETVPLVARAFSLQPWRSGTDPQTDSRGHMFRKLYLGACSAQ